MKIAVPTTQENNVDSHFGHCEYFTIFTVDGSEIHNSEIVESPQGCGCKSNIASTLREKGVEVMLAGNMGGGAVNVLNSYGIAVYRGCDGNVKNLVEEFIKGELVDSGESCRQHELHKGHNHHEEGHQCNHHN